MLSEYIIFSISIRHYAAADDDADDAMISFRFHYADAADISPPLIDAACR